MKSKSTPAFELFTRLPSPHTAAPLSDTFHGSSVLAPVMELVSWPSRKATATPSESAIVEYCVTSYISAPSIPAPWNTKTKGTDVLALSDWGRYATYVLVVPSTIRLR